MIVRDVGSRSLGHRHRQQKYGGQDVAGIELALSTLTQYVVSYLLVSSTNVHKYTFMSRIYCRCRRCLLNDGTTTVTGWQPLFYEKEWMIWSTDGEEIIIPICDSDIIVFLRSQSGEIGSSISTSLSPCSAVRIKVIIIFNICTLKCSTHNQTVCIDLCPGAVVLDILLLAYNNYG